MLKKLLLALALACTAFGQNPNTAVFPGGVATDSDLLVAANLAGSNLSSGINATTLTIPVASSASFIVPTVITVENEYIKICTKGSGVLNACMGGRAFDASTAATHASGVAVKANATRYYFNQLAAEVKAIEANSTANVMTTLGDTIYGGASGVQTRLAGNTTATKKFMTQTGNSLISASPGWNTIAAADVPTLNQDTTGTAAKATRLASTPTFTGCSVIKTVTAIDDQGNITCTAITTADSTHLGLLSAADWTTFNGKQASGNYITALTGDGAASGPGSAALTISKVNGVAYPASPSTDTLPLITSSNNAVYKAIPDCDDTSGNHLNYDTTTHAFSCGTSSSGGGGLPANVFDMYRPATVANSRGSPFSNGGSFSTGIKIYATANCTLKGIRFYFASAGGAKTMKITLWDNGTAGSGTTSQATATGSVNASSLYEIDFSPAQSLLAGHYYTLAVWENSGAVYTGNNPNDITPTLPFPSPDGPVEIILNKRYAAGDALPTSDGGDAWPVEPVFQ